MYHYGIRSTVTAPETMVSMVPTVDDKEILKRIKRNIERSKRPDGRYIIYRWPNGEPWNLRYVGEHYKLKEDK